VVVSTASVDLYNPKVVRASAGSLFHLPVVRDVVPTDAVRGLRDRGFRVLAAVAAGSGSVYDEDLRGPTVVMFGNEARGLPPELLGAADATIRVPIHGQAESLNLAAAATVVLFEAARQRAPGDTRAGQP
jgi:TrmH family RNA methyltransferase